MPPSLYGNLMHEITWQNFLHKEVSVTPKYSDMSVTVRPDWRESIYIEWDPVEDSKYVVYSSDTEVGPFRKLTAQPIEDNFLFSRDARQDRKAYDEYFTVEVIGPTTYRSYPVSPSVDLPRWHILRQKEIFRRELILLRKFVGVQTIIFTPRIRGTRCPECWSHEHEKVMDDHCTTCFGTSYKGGYNTGMETLMQYSSIDPVMQKSYQGNVEPVTVTGWTIGYPLIHPHAMILRVPDRKIFRVEGHQGSTELLTTTQRQTVVLRELHRDAIEYELFEKETVDVLSTRS